MLFPNVMDVKPKAMVLLHHKGAPSLAAWEYGQGRSVAFTADAAPHGAPPEFLDWEFFDRFWQQRLAWLARRS
jgi:uncharacterized membrane protein